MGRLLKPGGKNAFSTRWDGRKRRCFFKHDEVNTFILPEMGRTKNFGREWAGPKKFGREWAGPKIFGRVWAGPKKSGREWAGKTISNRNGPKEKNVALICGFSILLFVV